MANTRKTNCTGWKNWLFLSVLALLASCSPGKTATEAPETKDLAGTRWVLIQLNSHPVKVAVNGTVPWLRFEDKEKFSGHGGCNSISGTYLLEGNGSMTIREVMATKRACPALELENSFLKALEKTGKAVLQGDELSLSTGDGTELCRFLAEPGL